MDSDLVRIVFPLEPGSPHGITRERLWAKPLPEGTYLLDNSPFHAYGVSYGDIVRATLENDELVFREVVKRGGHSTYRIKLPRGKTHAYFLEFWPRLETLGCSYEGADDNRRLYAIDTAPSMSVHAVYKLLTELETAGVIEFEEGHYYDKSKEWQ
jgi:hypothetical protein